MQIVKCTVVQIFSIDHKIIAAASKTKSKQNTNYLSFHKLASIQILNVFITLLVL